MTPTEFEAEWERQRAQPKLIESWDLSRNPWGDNWTCYGTHVPMLPAGIVFNNFGADGHWHWRINDYSTGKTYKGGPYQTWADALDACDLAFERHGFIKLQAPRNQQPPPPTKAERLRERSV